MERGNRWEQSCRMATLQYHQYPEFSTVWHQSGGMSKTSSGIAPREQLWEDSKTCLLCLYCPCICWNSRCQGSEGRSSSHDRSGGCSLLHISVCIPSWSSLARAKGTLFVSSEVIGSAFCRIDQVGIRISSKSILRLVLKPCRHPDHRLWDLKINAPWTIRIPWSQDFCSASQILAEDYWSLSTDCFEDGLVWNMVAKCCQQTPFGQKEVVKWSNQSPISFCTYRIHEWFAVTRSPGAEIMAFLESIDAEAVKGAVGSTPAVVQCLWCWEIYRMSMVSHMDYIGLWIIIL